MRHALTTLLISSALSVYAAPASSCSTSAAGATSVCGVTVSLLGGQLQASGEFLTFANGQLATSPTPGAGSFQFCGSFSLNGNAGISLPALPFGLEKRDGAEVDGVTKEKRASSSGSIVYIDAGGKTHSQFWQCLPELGQLESPIYLTAPKGKLCNAVSFPALFALAGRKGKRAGSLYCSFAGSVPLYGLKTRSKRSLDAPRPATAVAPFTGAENNLVLGTMFRDKAQYLKEWIEFHAMVGVERFLLYDNGSKDSPLDVLQPYIDSGLVEYQAWPPASDSILPAPAGLEPSDARKQESMYKKSVATCRADDWSVHRPFACQVAASIDMLRRTTGKTEWLGFWDVDEFVFPTQRSQSNDLAHFLSSPSIENADQVVFRGSIFGSNEGDASASKSSLVSERYMRRRALNEHRPSPFKQGAKAFLDNAHVKGDLAQTFALPETSARKSIVRPNMAIWSTVHEWVPTAATASTWLSKHIALDDERVKLNHYAFLSKDEANAKAAQNGNPLAAFNEEQDAFYRAEIDTEITWLATTLRERLGLAATT